MTVGSTFNPYRVFQGVFAPYWILEHRGISTGAKLCYIRLLGYAGRDGRCYPSLGKLGTSLGVSDRQARDYVRELERAGFIQVEQRGLRKTNVYLFVWTAELEDLVNAVPAEPDDDPSGSDRNDCSAQDRNTSSAPDRNSCSGLERNAASGPIGINSSGRSSMESSSSSSDASPDGGTKTTTDSAILRWAQARGLRRLRSDRALGPPEPAHVAQWSTILAGLGIEGEERVFSVLDAARAAADRSGDWRNWSFLSLQVQLAAERMHAASPAFSSPVGAAVELPEEDPASDWAKLKSALRDRVGEIPFANWFERTRQQQRRDTELTVLVPDMPALSFLETEYRATIDEIARGFGIAAVRLVVEAAN